MKQFFFLSILCCLLAPLSHALTITGTITDAKTGQIVPGIYLEVQDSGRLQPATAGRTTPTGAYIINVSGTPFLGQVFRITVAPACGSSRQVLVSYTGSSTITANIAVCLGASNYSLYGRVHLGSGNMNVSATIHVIGVGVDTASLDSVVVYHDSFQTISGSGGLFFKQYPQLPRARLMMKAELNPGHSEFGAYIPTYFNTGPGWQTATRLTNKNYISDTADIYMIDTIGTSGPGCISGFARGNGSLLPGRIVVLTNALNIAMAYTYTDANGQFSFRNLGLGTYKIHGDVVPKLNPALTMTLTGTKPCVNNLVFEETSTTFSARVETLAVGSAAGNALDDLKPAPNPVSDELRIDGASKIEGSKQLHVRDVSGRVIARQTFGHGEELRLNTSGWPAGMYFLQLHTGIGAQSYRVSKQ